MFSSLLFKSGFYSTKVGARLEAKLFCDAFARDLDTIRESGGSFRSLSDNNRRILRDEFVGEWTTMALVKYVTENPPKFREQFDFINQEVIPLSECGLIPFSFITRMIIEYRFSAFYKHCKQLSIAGEKKGDEAIDTLYSIIVDVFREKGFIDDYEISMLD